MCWEEWHVILSQTILTILFRTKWFPIFSLQFLQIMMNFARFKNQRNIPSAALKSYKVVSWKMLVLWRKTPVFPMQGLLEDGGGCSEKQIPVSSSSLELSPSYRAPLRATPNSHWEHTTYVHLQQACCHSSDSDHEEGSACSAKPKWLLLGQISWTRAVSLEISSHWDSFPGLRHHVLSTFLQNLSKHNMWSRGHITEGDTQRTTCSIHGVT